MDEKQIKPTCPHNFEISRIVSESISARGANVHDVAYVVCTMCGEVKRQEITN